MTLEPEGAPFWKYRPLTHFVEPDPKVFTIRSNSIDSVNNANDCRTILDGENALHPDYDTRSIKCTRFNKKNNFLQKKLSALE
jgi:hypothetical protein